MTNQIKEGRIISIIHETMSHFLIENANKDSFITVSYVTMNKSGRTAYIYCSVFPADQEEKAFNFLKRKEGFARDCLRKKTSLKYIPHIRFLQTKETVFNEQSSQAE